MKERNAERIVGAIFPISQVHFTRFIKDKKTIFVKFTKFKRLKIGLKIIFYISGYKLLAGEGTIVDIKVLDTETAWKLYNRGIFLTKEEYDDYARKSFATDENRRTRNVTLFSLTNFREFRTQAKPVVSMTPAGYYITKEEYERISKN